MLWIIPVMKEKYWLESKGLLFIKEIFISHKFVDKVNPISASTLPLTSEIVWHYQSK